MNSNNSMMKQVFPKEIIENSAEVHQFKHSTKSKIIYLIILSAFAVALAALPFLSVDVYTSARGIIKPNKDRVVLNVINSGRIVFSDLLNNKRVQLGDTLLIIDNNGIDDRLEFSRYQLDETRLFVEDLDVLLKNQRVVNSNLKSSKYQRVHLQYSQKLRELRVRFIKAKRDFERNQILFNKDVISKSEYENKKFEYDLAISDIDQFRKQQKTTWQADLTQFKNSIKELMSNEEQLMKTKSQFVITAPIDGTLLNIKAQELGNYITVGSQLGEISPNTDLLVECYVSPSDIGLLKEKNKINFQVDAYNYNQWGIATGEVLEIGRDMELMDNKVVFKVRCKMDQNHLSLKNGFRGNLKKGMTLNANFELTRRSLYDLLYDKMDDWLNPSRNSIAQL